MSFDVVIIKAYKVGICRGDEGIGSDFLGMDDHGKEQHQEERGEVFEHMRPVLSVKIRITARKIVQKKTPEKTPGF